MSDHIPFEIQLEIIKKVSDVKSLVQFRSVSKPWKSFIDSSDFINGYEARYTQPHSHILSYRSDYLSKELKYVSLVAEDDNETFEVQQQEFAPSIVSPLLKQLSVSYVVGMCLGLLCVFSFHKVDTTKTLLLISNPFIGKSFGIALPRYDPAQTYIPSRYSFGVSPVTRDPTVVKFLCAYDNRWHVEVFTLSSGVWNVIPRSDLPRQLIKPTFSAPVVIDKFIYWGAREKTYITYKESTIDDMVMSFNLITKEFKVVNLPDSFIKELRGSVSVSKLRDSLVVYGCVYVDGAQCCRVWVMEHDSSFRKLFTIDAPVYKILGFGKSGETIFELRKEGVRLSTTCVYDPCSQKIKNLGLSGKPCSFFMGSYKKSLLLLDRLDSHIYYDNN